MIPQDSRSAGIPRSGTVQVGVGSLSIADVVRVARDGEEVSPLSPEVEERVRSSAAWVAKTVEQIAISNSSERTPVAYYGINTGFGALAGRSVLRSAYLTKALGRNLVASHSVGVGPYFPEAVVRSALLIRAQSLAQGYSGVRPLILETLIRMLNARVYPAVPEQGSLGASGDLAPLAHLLLVLCRVPSIHADDVHLSLDATDGEAFVPCAELETTARAYHHIDENYTTGERTVYRRVAGAKVMEAIGGKVELQAKEALALINGSTFSCALAALVVCDAENLLAHAELAVAMTLEGIRGFRDPFLPLLHLARGHRNAEQAASRVLRYVDGSQLIDPGDLRTNPVRVPPQDPYSVRCAPQVLGTVADTLELARRWVEMDINAATDNPLIFLDLERDYKTISGGNFHGEPIALAMDFVGIALVDLANMSERRMFMLNDYYPAKTYADPVNKYEPLHGLHSFLINAPAQTAGLSSGLMMLQATAAALVSDCKALAHPDSIDSIPSSGNQEDHVSMSLNAARHAREIVTNVEYVLALEFLCAAQAIELQLGKRGNSRLGLGKGTRAARDEMRAAGIDVLMQDRVLYPDIRKAIRLVRTGSLLRAARVAALEESSC
jgi:histidine ammonia-lyase